MNKPKTLQPFIRFCMTIGEIPTSYMNSMTYEEQIIWLCNFLEKEVIPVVNNNSEVVKELQNWFENLDVQEEVNNKIEEMYESGQLQEIITAYLKINGVLGFNTIADMKQATNLIDGSICKTLGSLLYNDGKGNYYKIRTITSSDIVDEINIISLTNFNTLIAELIPNYYINDINENINNINENINNINENIIYENVKLHGVYGDGTHDDTEAIQDVIDNYDNVFFPKGTYLISNTLNIKMTSHIIGENMVDSIINNSSSNYSFAYERTGNHKTTNIIFENMTILGKNGIRINNDNLSESDWLNQSSLLNLHFKNLLIQGTYGDATDTNKNTNVIANLTDLKNYGIGLNLNKIFDSEIKQCQIELFGIATYLKGCDINLIENNRMTNNGNHIYLDRIDTYGSQNRIVHNDLLVNLRYGGITINATRFDTIEDNYFEHYNNSATFIYGINEFELSILNNRFDNPGINDINIINLSPVDCDIISFNRINPQSTDCYINVNYEQIDLINLKNNNTAIIDNNNTGISLRNNPATLTNFSKNTLISPYSITNSHSITGTSWTSPYFLLDNDKDLYYFKNNIANQSLILYFFNLNKYYTKSNKTLKFTYSTTTADNMYAVITGFKNGVSTQLFRDFIPLTKDGNINIVEKTLTDTQYEKYEITCVAGDYKLYSLELI